MSNGKRNRRPKQNQPGQKAGRETRPAAPPPKNPLQEAAELGTKAAEAATTEGVEEPDIPAEPEELSLEELLRAIAEARQSKEIYDRAAGLAGRRQAAPHRAGPRHI